MGLDSRPAFSFYLKINAREEWMAKLGDFRWPADPPGSILFTQILIEALEVAAETMTKDQLRLVAERADRNVDEWASNHQHLPAAVQGAETARSALGIILRR